MCYVDGGSVRPANEEYAQHLRGLVAHTDLSALTILLPNDVPGLQVFVDDHWFDMKYVPGALVVHVGDQVEVRTIYL